MTNQAMQVAGGTIEIKMSINQFELVQLLEDDIFMANTYHDDDLDETCVHLEYGNFNEVWLEYMGGQTYEVVCASCHSDDFFEGCTVSIDEILDYVLNPLD